MNAAEVLPLRVQEDTARVATTDRTATADAVLEVAVKDAIRYLRTGQPGHAEFRLTRAGLAAERILGPTGGAR